MAIPSLTGPLRKFEMAVAAFGLPRSSHHGLESIGEDEWEGFVARMRQERMEGLLIAAVEAEVLPSTPSRITQLRELGRARARADLELERETLRCARRLESEGLDYRLVKGPALAWGFYDDPIWRGFGDVDLLLPADTWYLAVSILEASGARRVVPEIRPHFDVRFGKDATFVSPTGREVDLHRRLVIGPYGFWATSDEVFSNRKNTVRIGASDLAVLDAEDAFLYACYSAALADYPPRLMSLRDVAQISFAGAMDVDRIAETAARWHGMGVVSRALSLSEDTLGVPLSGTDVGRRFRHIKSTAVQRLLMAAYRGPGRGYTSQLAGVVALQGVRERLAYLGALARPQNDYLRARGFTRSGFIVHAGRLIGRHR